MKSHVTRMGFVLASVVACVTANALLHLASCPYGTEGICGTRDNIRCNRTAVCLFLDKNLFDDAGLCCTKKTSTGIKVGQCPSPGSEECPATLDHDECFNDFTCMGSRKCCQDGCGVFRCVSAFKDCKWQDGKVESGTNFPTPDYNCNNCYCYDGDIWCTKRKCEMKT